MIDEAGCDLSEENCPVHHVPLVWRYDGVVKVYVPEGIYGRRHGVYEVPRTRRPTTRHIAECYVTT
jgi:hypothetical protein